MKKILARAIQSLPLPLAVLPYSGFLVLLRLIANFYRVDIWPRNSYLTRSFTPGISDLDLTLYIPSTTSNTNVDRFVAKYLFLKKRFIFLGEMNIYFDADIELMSTFLNSYELDRDPYLKMKINFNPLHHEKDRYVFLLRLFEADYKNLLSRPESRINKWSDHLNTSFDTTKDIFSKKIILEHISKSIEVIIPHETSYNFFLDLFTQNPSYVYSRYRKNKEIRYFILLAPNKWLVYANGINDVDICLNHQHFNLPEIELILSQIMWEVLHLLIRGDYYRSNSHEASNYILMIQDFLSKLNTSDENAKKMIQATSHSLEIIMKSRAAAFLKLFL